MKFYKINLRLLFRKIFALMFAIILWVFITENNVVVDQKTVDVIYKNLPDNVIMVESLQKISYTISKNPYYPEDIKINVIPYVEISDNTPGWHTFPIKLDMSSPLPSYANIRLSLNSARVLLDNKSTKTVLIKPNIDILNKNDFSIANVRISPSITQINGPQSILDKINNIFLDTVTVDRAGEFKMDVPLLIPSNSIEVQDKKINVLFSVIPKFKEQTMKIPISYRNLPVGFSVSQMSIKEIELKVKGLNSYVDTISNNSDSLVYVDLSHIDSGGNYLKLPIKIDLPSGITLLNQKSIPPSIDISITSVVEGIDEEIEIQPSTENKELNKNYNNPDKNSLPFLLELPNFTKEEEKTPDNKTITENPKDPDINTEEPLKQQSDFEDTKSSILEE